jgi:dihydroorotate dehydrogenase electron transfer subunit
MVGLKATTEAREIRPGGMIDAKIIERRMDTDSICTIKLDPAVHPIPGQYAMIWVKGVDEIPMSFSSPDEITVQSVGAASAALFSHRPGEHVGIRGPLGNGFVLPDNLEQDILLIGGGVGAAPLSFLGERAREEGISVTSIMGFRSSNDIVFLNRLKGLGEVVLTTDDGSEGTCGRASAGLSAVDLERFGQIYLCGPEMMMWDVISCCKPFAPKIQVLLTRYIKCAVGICGSCCLDPYGIRTCVEGPVIRADLLLESEFGRYRRGPSGSKGQCRG